MNKTVLLISLLASIPLSAAELELGHGVELLVINGEKPTEEQKLQEGDNQIVVEFDARLKSGSKKEPTSTTPQILFLPNLNRDSEVLVKLSAKNHKELESAIRSSSDLFDVRIDEEWIDVEQTELPAKAGLFPYIDPVGLTKQYNKSQGLVYESGRIRTLSKELEQVQVGQKYAATNKNEQTISETEVTLQLKIWYSKATSEERAHFRDWMLQQLRAK